VRILTTGLFTLLVISLGFSFSTAFGEIAPNNAFILDGAGFAVSEEIIRISEMDLAILSQQQTGSSINSTVEDGFITLDDQDFLATELQATFLREGKYIRINGNIEDESGIKASLGLFGRLVEESKSASVYGFTGRITNGDDSYKVIYTTKLSNLSTAEPIPTESTTSEDQIIIHILEGSSSRGIVSSYIEGSSITEQAASQSSSEPFRLRYFSQDRISVEPGTTITIVNDDIVSHSIQSGKENYGDRYNQFTPDGRISTGDISPGASITISLDEAGFYRLYDPDYQWMKIVAYVFPDVDSIILGQGQNLGN